MDVLHGFENFYQPNEHAARRFREISHYNFYFIYKTIEFLKKKALDGITACTTPNSKLLAATLLPMQAMHKVVQDGRFLARMWEYVEGRIQEKELFVNSDSFESLVAVLLKINSIIVDAFSQNNNNDFTIAMERKNKLHLKAKAQGLNPEIMKEIQEEMMLFQKKLLPHYQELYSLLDKAEEEFKNFVRRKVYEENPEEKNNDRSVDPNEFYRQQQQRTEARRPNPYSFVPGNQKAGTGRREREEKDSSSAAYENTGAKPVTPPVVVTPSENVEPRNMPELYDDVGNPIPGANNVAARMLRLEPEETATMLRAQMDPATARKLITDHYRKLVLFYHPDRQEEAQRPNANKNTARLTQSRDHLIKIFGK